MTTTITLSLMALAHMLDTHQVLEAETAIFEMTTDEVYANLEACRINSVYAKSELEDLLENAYRCKMDGLA